jgi:hypothetical protein
MAKQNAAEIAVRVLFHRCLQNSQDLGTNDDHLVSRVDLSLEYGGQRAGPFSVTVKQSAGADYATAPLEVSKPSGYDGPFNYAQFRACVEQYYRNLVGSSARGIRISGGGQVIMRDNLFEMPAKCEFHAANRTEQAW